MNWLTRILFSIGFIVFTTKRIDKWTKKRYVNKLEYALKHGLFNIRKRAVEGLGEIGTEECITILETAIDDQLKIVSLTAIKMLEKYELTNKLKTVIKNKKEYWAQKELKEEKNLKTHKTKLKNIHKWKRSSRETYENFKERVKKPIR